jgi:predicted tellurium resistance membrane protein TerC
LAEWHCGQNEAGYWQIQNLVPHHKQKKGVVAGVCASCAVQFVFLFLVQFVFQEKTWQVKTMESGYI